MKEILDRAKDASVNLHQLLLAVSACCESMKAGELRELRVCAKLYGETVTIEAKR